MVQRLALGRSRTISFAWMMVMLHFCPSAIGPDETFPSLGEPHPYPSGNAKSSRALFDLIAPKQGDSVSLRNLLPSNGLRRDSNGTQGNIYGRHNKTHAR
jgi:hypothetical protein